MDMIIDNEQVPNKGVISVSQVVMKDVIIGEINNVMAAMRLNSRWSHKTRQMNMGASESPLIRGFKTLRKTLEESEDIAKEDSLTYLQPFLSVIRSDETSGPITGVALNSVRKFIDSLITLSTPSARSAVEGISDAVTHCRFEATDPGSDEVVLAKILQVLSSCFKSPVGLLLSDDQVIEMIQTCFKMSWQSRLSELLRRTAEYTMISIYENIFGRFASKDKGDFPSYQISCLEKLLNFACSNISVPHNTNEETNRMEGDTCLLSLNMVLTIVESSVQSIRHQPSLIKIIQEQLTHRLLKCIYCDELMICTMSLRILLHLFLSLKEQVKPQMEMFFLSIMQLVEKEKRSTYSYEKHETILETVLDFCKHPTFLTQVYLNFDCDFRSPNLYGLICSFLQKSALPLESISGNRSGIEGIHSINVLAVEAFGAISNNICKRLLLNNSENDVAPYQAQLKRTAIQKKLKNNLTVASEMFSNNDNKFNVAIDFLIQNEILPPMDDPQFPLKMALFLRYAYGIDKKRIGEYIVKKAPTNTLVLEEYIKTLQIEGEVIDSTLRELMESMRPPGESAPIEHLLAKFSEYYYHIVGAPFNHPDAVMTLCYSIIILNVDSHSAQLGKKAKRMEEAEFIKNLRGLNLNQDYPQPLLKAIYHRIKSNEFRNADEWSGQIGELSWKQLPLKYNANAFNLFSNGKVNGSYVDVENELEASLYDYYTFPFLYTHLIRAISAVFEYTNDESTMEFLIGNINALVHIASSYNSTGAVDDIVSSLVQYTHQSTEVKNNNHLVLRAQSLLGSNKKALLAMKTAFFIMQKYTDYTRNSWNAIITFVLQLNKLALLPSFIEKYELIDPESSTAKAANNKTNTKTSGSLFGMIGNTTSWFWGSSTPPPVPHKKANEEEDASEHLEHKLDNLLEETDPVAEKNAAECVKDCDIPQLFNHSKDIAIESLDSLLKAIIASASNKNPDAKGTQLFEEKKRILFCMDLLTSVTLTNSHRIGQFWNTVSNYFTSVLESSSKVNDITEKAVVNLLIMAIELAKKNCLIVEVISSLQSLLKMNTNVSEALAKKIMVGVSQLASVAPDFVKSDVGWNTLSSFLDFSTNFSSSESVGYKILSNMLTKHTLVTASSYPNWITLILFFTKPRCSVQTATSAMELLHSLFSYVKELLGDSSKNNNGVESSQVEQAWTKYSLPILQQLCVLCQDQRPEVRSHAMSYLQRSLLSNYLLSLPPKGCLQCFDQVAFPLMQNLLDDKGLDPSGLEETRSRACALLSKLFLQFLHQISDLPEFIPLWMRILDYMEAYMKADISDHLAEAVREAAKNILLVMTSIGFLPKNGSLWNSTWERLDKFCPQLRQDWQNNFPDELTNPQQSPNPTTIPPGSEPLSPPQEFHSGLETV
eukprot:TRINITY_DN4750_c0_g1_i1.p1 TRINITY_DN4750_c0_g1~~TRINITY_DN4750_c0_g1_i1.p1  ORF type:complete len:1400 (-),score=487.09 TRINITY_DN4750_c0_g1_i1:60-4232(-)